MTKKFTRTDELLAAYTKTPATTKTLAQQFGVCRETVSVILRNNLDPALYEKLKAKKHQQTFYRVKKVKYRVQHGL